MLAMIFFASVLILGIYSLSNSSIELVPDEKLPALSISANWYGASAEMVVATHRPAHRGGGHGHQVDH